MKLIVLQTVKVCLRCADIDPIRVCFPPVSLSESTLIYLQDRSCIAHVQVATRYLKNEKSAKEWKLQTISCRLEIEIGT